MLKCGLRNPPALHLCTVYNLDSFNNQATIPTIHCFNKGEIAYTISEVSDYQHSDTLITER